MGEFFGSIYCQFEDLFGLDLADYLWGVASPEQTANMYIGVGLWMFSLSLLFAVLYYYIVDNPRIAKWWGWGIFLVANAVVNFLIGWQRTLYDYEAGLMVKIDQQTGQEVALNIQSVDCLSFGVANMILAAVTFFLFSMAIKWWSSSSAHVPF